MTNPPVLVCKVAWMERYRGNTDRDKPYGGGGFVNEFGYGYEVFNFQPYRGKIYGYVRAPGGSDTINVDRLIEPFDRNRTRDHVDGVTVIWIATNPNDGSTYVIGWYRDARVYRKSQDPVRGLAFARHVPTGHGSEYEVCSFQIETDEPNAVCLKLADRTYSVPMGRGGGMGRARTWFPPDGIARECLALTDGGPKRRRRSKAGSRQPDIEKRQLVERTAQKAVEDYFASQGFEVEDVSTRALGWDVEARSGDRLLRIEVKGHSGGGIAAELTPNEYTALQNHRDTFRLCIVTDVLEPATLSIHVFSYVRGKGAWYDQAGNLLRIDVVEGARVRA